MKSLVLWLSLASMALGIEPRQKFYSSSGKYLGQSNQAQGAIKYYDARGVYSGLARVSKDGKVVKFYNRSGVYQGEQRSSSNIIPPMLRPANQSKPKQTAAEQAKAKR